MREIDHQPDEPQRPEPVRENADPGVHDAMARAVEAGRQASQEIAAPQDRHEDVIFAIWRPEMEPARNTSWRDRLRSLVGRSKSVRRRASSLRSGSLRLGKNRTGRVGNSMVWQPATGEIVRLPGWLPHEPLPDGIESGIIFIDEIHRADMSLFDEL